MLVAVLVLLAFAAGAACAWWLAPRSREDAEEAVAVDEQLPPAHLRSVVDALASGVVVVDSEDTVTWANPAAAALRVTAANRLAARSLRDVARRARLSVDPVHDVVDLGDGREARVSATALLGSGAIALVVEDNTEARRIDAVRRDFVANVSHELKTPVGAISLLSEALGDYDDDPDARRRFTERMRVESERLSRLIQELIDLSRLQGAEPMQVDAAVPVARVVAEAVDRTRLAAGASKIDVVTEVDPGLVVPGDERQLATALANLLDNAVAYSGAGTHVAVTARRRGDEVEIAVRDEGIGIAAEDLPRIFERFYRVDPARSRDTGGTGLGLAIVKHITTNHGGRIDVWSVEGTGSTFTLTLPACVAEAVRVGGAA